MLSFKKMIFAASEPYTKNHFFEKEGEKIIP